MQCKSAWNSSIPYAIAWISSSRPRISKEQAQSLAAAFRCLPPPPCTLPSRCLCAPFVRFSFQGWIVIDGHPFRLRRCLYPPVCLLDDMRKLVSEELLSTLAVWLVLAGRKVDIRTMRIGQISSTTLQFPSLALRPSSTRRRDLDLLASGLDLWASGLDLWASGLDRWASGLDRWASGLDLWASGLDRWASGLDRWASGLDLWASGLDLWASGLDRWASGLDLWASGLDLWASSLDLWASSLDLWASSLDLWTSSLDF